MVAERADDPGHHGLRQDTLQVTGNRPLDQGNAQISEVRSFDDVTAPYLMNRFEALRGSRLAGVTWVVDSGAEVSCLSTRAYRDLVQAGFDLPQRSEVPRLKTATNGEI